MSSFNKLVFDKDIQVNSIAYMRLDQYDSPFVLEDNTTNCWTLYDMIQGELHIRIGAETAVLRGGDILLLSAEWPHSIRVTGQTPTRVFTMALELDGKGLERLGRLQTALSPSGFQALGDIIDYADDIFNITADSRQYTDSVDKDTTVSVKQILQAKIELFLLELLEQCPEAQDAAPVSRSQLVARTNEELRRHLCDSVSIEDICQRLNLSKSYLSSLYKRKTGKSIIAHFNEMKIEEARRLIASGRYNFTEIAERLGFSSIHYFSRMFKSVAGMTPSEYEKSLKKGGA